MSNLRKTYFLSPSFDFTPDGPIFLGSLVADPRNPVRPLNSYKSSRVPPPENIVKKMVKRNWREAKLRPNNGKVGVWVAFVQMVLGLGASIGVNCDRDESEAYEFEQLETIYFEPDDEEGYLEALLAKDSIKNFVTRSKFKKPLYLVTGIKIARGGKVKTAKKRLKGVEFEVGLDGTAIAAPVSLGPKIEAHGGNTNETEWGESDDFVFAYRLRMIMVKQDSYDAKDFTKGALYDLHAPTERASNSEVKVESSTEVGGFSTQELMEAVEDHDEEEACWIVSTQFSTF